MEVELNTNSTGLQTLWILSTMGSKSSKLIKKNILNISIPQLCTELIHTSTKSTTHSNHIRYVGNLMHGLSILYSNKIKFFLDDLTYVDNRIKCIMKNQYSIIPSNNNNIENQLMNDNRLVRKRDRFWKDVGLGELVFDVDNDQSLVLKKRRVVDMMDMEIFPVVSINDLRYDSIGFAFSQIGGVDNGIGMEFGLNSNHIRGYESEGDVMVPDFEFNDDGEIIDIENGENLVPEKSESGENSLLDIVFEENQPQNVPGETAQEGSISHDYDFQTTDPQMQKIPTFRMRFDNETRISSEILIQSLVNYETSMSEKNVPLPQVKTVNDVYDEISALGPFFHRVNRIALPYHYKDRNSSLEYSSFTRTISIIQRTEDAVLENTEEGRELIRNAVDDHENLLIGDAFDMVGDDQDQVVNSPDHIFDLEFDYENQDERVDVRDSTWTSSESSTTETSSSHMDKKLLKFYKYITTRIKEFGNSSDNINYQINFGELVPTNNHNNDNDKPVTRKIAANAFSSILTLATKELLVIKVSENDDWELHNSNEIDIILQL